MSDEKVDQQIQPKETQQSDRVDTGTKVDKSPEDYAKILSDLSAENKKYRQTYSQYKSELEETRAQLRALQESSLMEQGKYKDLYEKSARELEAERMQRKKDLEQWTGTVVASRLAAEATKHSCVDPMALIKIATADGLLSEPGLVAEDTFEVNQEAIQSIVQKARKDYQYLFGKPTPSPKDGVPKVSNQKLATQDLSKMKIEDLMELAKQYQ